MVPNKRAVKYVLALKKDCDVRKMFYKGFFSEFSKLWNILSFIDTSRKVTVVSFWRGRKLQTEIVLLSLKGTP